MGDNTTTQRNTPVTVTGLTGVQSMVLGDIIVCALVTSTNAKGVKCWGYNAKGGVGNGTVTSPQKTPSDVSGLTDDVTALYSNGYRTFCALKTDNSLRCWGYNYIYGYLGDGTAGATAPGTAAQPSQPYEYSATPVTPLNLSTTVASLEMTTNYSCAITTSGGLYCWGKESGEYETGDSVRGGSHFVLATQPNSSDLSANVSKVVANDASTCAIVSGGGVRCWGANTYGQLGNNTTTASISPVTVQGLSGVTVTDLVSHDGQTWCALSSVGGVYCWGYNGQRSVGDNTNTNRSVATATSNATNGETMASGVLRIFASRNATSRRICAIKLNSVASDYDLYCWGHQNYGQLGDGTGSTTGTSSYQAIPKLINSGWYISNANANTLSMGIYVTCAVTSAGGAKCWGMNNVGQLGDNSTTYRNAPVDVNGLTSGVSQIHSGNGDAGATLRFTCAVLSAGGVKCWGGNTSVGVLGNATTTASSTPVSVLLSGGGSLANVTKMVLGYQHSIALLSDGTLKGWGLNTNNQLGDGTATSRTSAVSVTGLSATVSDIYLRQDGGNAHTTCALLTTGKVQCWGYADSYDSVGNNTGANSSTAADVYGFTSGVSSYTMGSKQTCGILTGGQVKCRGYNDDGTVGSSPQVRGPTALTGYE